MHTEYLSSNSVVHTENKVVQANYKYILEMSLCSVLNNKQDKKSKIWTFRLYLKIDRPIIEEI